MISGIVLDSNAICAITKIDIFQLSMIQNDELKKLLSNVCKAKLLMNQENDQILDLRGVQYFSFSLHSKSDNDSSFLCYEVKEVVNVENDSSNCYKLVPSSVSISEHVGSSHFNLLTSDPSACANYKIVISE